MAYEKPNQITVSGAVVLDKCMVSGVGDIYLYRNDDKGGSFARAGRHTNYGYSGYYLAGIFDGKDWRKIQFNKLVPYKQRSYEQAGQCQQVVNHVINIVRGWRGFSAIYDGGTRSFRILHIEMPDV